MKRNLIIIVILHGLLLPASSTQKVYSATMQSSVEREFDDDFKKRYANRKYNYEGEAVTPPPRYKNKIKSEKYTDETPYIKEENIDNDILVSFDSMNWVLGIILFIAVFFLAYFLVTDGNAKLFSSRKHKKINSSEDITADNIIQTDINTLITSAENKNDFRLAIRYYYLLVLKQLTLKNFIKYADDKTNADYINAIATQKFNKDFQYTSYLYSYTWYGEFDLNKDQYHLAKASFVQLLKAIN